MYLPLPPTLQERVIYLDSGRYKLYIVSVFTTAMLLIGMALFVWINPLFIPYTVMVIITSAYLIMSYALGIVAKDFDYSAHQKLVTRHIDRSDAQEVDIYLPICNEPIEVIANSWKNIAYCRQCHEGKMNVFVLDDGKSEEAKKLAKFYDFHYITRPTNELKKAGNLRNAFKQTSAPFFAIFDADFCPSNSFLLNTLPYMYENHNVSIVQTPQYFETEYRDLNKIQRGSAQIQELFYRLIQVSRDYFKGAICVGTSALYRRAHLEPHGGTAPIEWSEDVHTTVLLMKDGRGIKYIPLILTKGMCPDTWKQFFTQFYRWSTGSLSLMIDKTFWTSRLTLIQKICFSTGFGFYVTTGLHSILAFTPSIYLLIFKPSYVFWFNILWAVPSIILTNIYLRFWQKTGYSWAAIQARAISGYAHLFALTDLLFKRTEGWIPTGGQGRSGRFQTFKTFVVYHIAVLCSVLLCLIVYRSGEIGYVNSLPIIILFIYHVATLWPIIKENWTFN